MDNNVDCFRNSHIHKIINNDAQDIEPKCIRVEIPNFRMCANYSALPNGIFKEYLDSVMVLRTTVNSLHFLATKNLINGDAYTKIYETIREDILPELVAKLDILVSDAKYNSQFKYVDHWATKRDWEIAYEYALNLYTEMKQHESF